MTEESISTKRSTLVTVVAWIDVGLVLVNLGLGAVRGVEYLDKMKVAIGLVVLTAVGLFMRNRLGRIMAAIMGVVFALACLFGLSQFGRLPAWYVLATIALCATLAVLHFQARARLAQESAARIAPGSPAI